MNLTGLVYIHVERRELVAPIDMLKIADAIPVGCELLGFVRVNPAVVRLIVGVGSCHKLDIGSVGVGENLAVPGVSVVHVTPGPELAALVDVVVSRKHGSGVLAVVISSHEVVLLVIDEHGATHKGREILPVADINSCIVRIPAVFPVRHRPAQETVLVVESSEVGALRKDNLVIFVRMSRDIVPMEHGVAVLSVVEEASRDLDVGLVRI